MEMGTNIFCQLFWKFLFCSIILFLLISLCITHKVFWPISKNIQIRTAEMLMQAALCNARFDCFLLKTLDLMWGLQYGVIILSLIQAFKNKRVYFPLIWKGKSRKGFIFFYRLFFLRKINIAVDLLQLNNLLLMHKSDMEGIRHLHLVRGKGLRCLRFFWGETLSYICNYCGWMYKLNIQLYFHSLTSYICNI